MICVLNMTDRRQPALLSSPDKCASQWQGFSFRLRNRSVSTSYEIPTDHELLLDLDWGIIIYWTLETGELHKYNATMKHYVPTSTHGMHSESSSFLHEIAHLEIHGEFVATLDQTRRWVGRNWLAPLIATILSSLLTLSTLDAASDRPSDSSNGRCIFNSASPQLGE